MTVRFLRWLTLGVLLVGLGLAPAVDALAKSRGLSVPLKASEAKGAPVEAEVELYSKSYAMVVGIDRYGRGWQPLSQAVKDARRVASALEQRGFEVTLKTNLKSDELENAFEDFFIDNGRDPDARLFVWYAGHGYTVNGEGYLIPSDGAAPNDERRFLRTALSRRRFGEFVRLAESKHVFTIFDSCFAGTIFSVARSAPPPAITRVTTQPVRQFLTSGDVGQTVSDDGTFATLFIEALAGTRRADGNGDGYLTASEIGNYVGYTMSNLTNNRQTPRHGKLRSARFDKGDFVFAVAKEGQGTAASESPGSEARTSSPRRKPISMEVPQVARLPLSRFDGEWKVTHSGDGSDCTGTMTKFVVKNGRIEGAVIHPEDIMDVVGSIDASGKVVMKGEGAYSTVDAWGEVEGKEASGEFSSYTSETGHSCDGIWKATKVGSR